MGFFSKGSNTTTQTTSPNPQAMAEYNAVLNRAQSVASQPYNPYTGQLVADINQQQQMGIGNINANAGFAQPYIQQAAGYANQAAGPITADQIAQYQNPYTQQVVDATQEQFRHANAVQQQQVMGNAAAQGALGGDRVKIAQAELARGQQAAQAPVIAGLYSQGYQQALAAAQNQAQREANAAYSLGNLGVSGQGAALQGAGAQLGAGGLEQQTEQARLNALYNQFQLAQAFPYQQAQWLAGITTGVGSQMGGTSTTTGPAPNPWAQAAGLGLAGAGAYFGGPAGAAAGYQVGSRAFAADGGRIRGYALGGTPYGGEGAPGIGGVPYAGVQGYVPMAEIARGQGAPKPPGQPQPDSSANQMVNQAMGLARAMGSRAGRSSEDIGSGDVLGWTYQNGQMVPTYGGNTGADITGVGEVPYSAGGFVLPHDNRIELPRGYDDGGLVRGGFGGASFLPDFSPTYPGAFSAPSGLADARDALLARGVDLARERAQAGDYREFAPIPSPGVPTKTAGMGLPPIVAQEPEEDAGDDEGPALGFAPRQGGAPPPAQETVEPTTGETGGFSLPGRGLLSPEASHALMAAGFGMMASKSPFLGTAIGEGGLAGVNAYNQQQQQKLADQNAKAKIALTAKHYQNEADKLDMMAKRYQADIAERTRQHDLQAQKPVKVGEDQMGRPVFMKLNPKNGQYEPVSIPGVEGPPNVPAPQSVAPVRAMEISADEAALPYASALSASTQTPAQEEFLKTLPPEVAAQVKTYAEGRDKLPAKDSPYRRNMIYLLSQYDPNFNASDYNTRWQTRKDFTSGPTSKNVTALNTVVGHLGELDEAGRALKNWESGALGPLSKTANSLTTLYREHNQDPRVVRFNTAANAVANEMERAFRGNTTAIAGIKEWRQSLNPSMSPQELQASLKTMVTLLHGRMDAVADQYNRGMGTNLSSDAFIAPKARDIYNKLGNPEGVAAPAENKPPVADRYRQLRRSGVSEEDAYKTLRSEGYK